MQRTINDKIIQDINKAVDELYSRIPKDRQKLYYNVRRFTEGVIYSYLNDNALPLNYFKGFIREIKKTKPESLIELEELRQEYGASFYTWPEHYKKRIEIKKNKKQTEKTD